VQRPKETKAAEEEQKEILYRRNVRKRMVAMQSLPLIYPRGYVARQELAPFTDRGTIGCGCQGFVGPTPSTLLDESAQRRAVMLCRSSQHTICRLVPDGKRRRMRSGVGRRAVHARGIGYAVQIYKGFTFET